MPFTGSHPAAVLPLLRTPLPASALVAGSVAPDIPFYLPGTHPGRWGAEHLPVLARAWGPLPGVRWLDHALGILGGLVLLAWLVRWWWRTPAVPATTRPRWWLPWAVVAVAGLVGGLSAVGGAPDLRSAAVGAVFRGGGVLLATAVVLALVAVLPTRVRRAADAGREHSG